MLFTTLLNKSSYKKITNQNYIIGHKPKSLKSNQKTFLQKLFSKVNIIVIVLGILVIFLIFRIFGPESQSEPEPEPDPQPEPEPEPRA